MCLHPYGLQAATCRLASSRRSSACRLWMALPHSLVLASPGDAHERLNIEDLHSAALLQVNDLPRRNWLRTRLTVSMVSASRSPMSVRVIGKDNEVRILPPARIAARKFHEEDGHPLRCRALAYGEKKTCGRPSAPPCHQLPERHAQGRILARGALDAFPWQAPQTRRPGRLVHYACERRQAQGRASRQRRQNRSPAVCRRAALCRGRWHRTRRGRDGTCGRLA